MDGIKEILSALETRLRSKLLGSIIIAFILINWKVIFFVIFEQVGAKEKFSFFDDNTSPLSLYLFPVVAGTVFALVMPWVSYLVMFISFSPERKKRELRNNSEHQNLLNKWELNIQLKEFQQREDRIILDRAKMKEDIKKIDDPVVRKDVTEEIEKNNLTQSEKKPSVTTEGNSFTFTMQSLESLDKDIANLEESKEKALSKREKTTKEIDNLKLNLRTLRKGASNQSLSHNEKVSIIKELEENKALLKREEASIRDIEKRVTSLNKEIEKTKKDFEAHYSYRLNRASTLKK